MEALLVILGLFIIGVLLGYPIYNLCKKRKTTTDIVFGIIHLFIVFIVLLGTLE